MIKSTFTSISAAAALVVLAACGGSTDTSVQSTPPTGSTSSPATSAAATSNQVSLSPTASSGPTSPSSAVPPSVTRRPGVPQAAFPGAGGPVPPGAIALPTSTSGDVLLATPSKINGCVFGRGMAMCTTTARTAPPPDPTVTAGFLSIDLLKSPLTTTGYGTDQPDWFSQGTVLQYGQSGYWKTLVCGSNRNGLTCWNTTTGHGALINGSGITIF